MTRTASLTSHQAEVLWDIAVRGEHNATPQTIGSRGACQHLIEKGFAAFNGSCFILTGIGRAWYERTASRRNTQIDIDGNVHDRSGTVLSIGDTVQHARTGETGRVTRFFKNGPTPKVQTHRGAVFNAVNVYLLEHADA